MSYREEDEGSRGGDEYRFHYSREERIAQRHWDPGRRITGGILRGNRSLLILLLDLVLVMVLYIIATLFLFPDSDRLEIGGWSLHLSGSTVGQDVAAELACRRIDPIDPGQETLARILFRAGGVTVPVDELLPERGTRTVRVTLRGAGDETGRIEAEVIIGDRKAVLRAKRDD